MEPHRFEDLIRQLVYDFRNWRRLEATGRAGSDDGFDARGWEIANFVTQALDEKETDDQEYPDSVDMIIDDRIWLIQCKREKSITPKKIEKYLDDISERERDDIYGTIFVAPADFSKKSRDIFRQKCIEFGIDEYQLWGKAELEDMLFQSKNDHLLFAYFGFSIVIRRRSARTKIRSRLATKRKAMRAIGDGNHLDRTVLIRDANEDRYPYSDEIEDFDEFPRWKAFTCIGHYHSGLIFLIRKHFAYVAEDEVHWDYIEEVNDARPNDIAYFRQDQASDKNHHELRNRAHRFWLEMPDENKAWYSVEEIVPYDDILAIDEDGDTEFRCPHIYVEFDRVDGPFFGGRSVLTAEWRNLQISPETENRIEYFPKELPEVKPRGKVPILR